MAKGIEVIGLSKFAKKLRAAKPELAKQLRLGFKKSAEVVAGEAKPRVPVRSGKLQRSIRAQSTAKSASVSMGSNAVPYAGFIEYGGSVGRNKSVSRPLVRSGRYLRPSYEARRPEVEALAEAALKAVADGMN